MTGWRRITSQHPQLHTVYWVLGLEDGRRCAVVRQYEADGSTPRYGTPWLWKVYSAPPRKGAASTVLAEGEAPNVQAGRKRATDAAAAMPATWKRAQ